MHEMFKGGKKDEITETNWQIFKKANRTSEVEKKYNCLKILNKLL